MVQITLKFEFLNIIYLNMIMQFEKSPDPELPGHFLMEQYQVCFMLLQYSGRVDLYLFLILFCSIIEGIIVMYLMQNYG